MTDGTLDTTGPQPAVRLSGTCLTRPRWGRGSEHGNGGRLR
jgi:hypothetical protein